MNPKTTLPGVALRCALVSGLCLFGGMLLGLAAGFAISGLPMHLPERTTNLISILLVLGILIAAGAVWGYWMGRTTGVGKTRRMTWAGGLSFAPAIFLAALMLSRLEVAIVERGGGPDLPVHVVFTLLFVPAAFFVAGLGGLAFLIVNVIVDALGWRVGAPGAAERATMLTVMMISNLGTALAGSAAIGVLLGSHALQGNPALAPHASIEAEAA